MMLVLCIVIPLLDIIGYFVADGRAIMVEPPHRSSLWRYHYPTHVNTEDDLLNCGGFDVQWLHNGGRCGVCGDPAGGPLEHDDNGHFASGITVRSYNQGGSVNVTVEVLSNLLGYFEFRLCPRNDTSTKLTQECFEQNVLWIEESWSTRFHVGSRGGIYDLHVKLPTNIVCTNCVFQWKYSTGYRMGGINRCECMGCGKQEQFYNCADVAITPNPGTSTTQPFGFLPVKPNPSFLLSPEHQSYIFVQRLREQLPVFPWPSGMLIPHNMMSTSSRYDKSENGHGENGDHMTSFDDVLLSDINNITRGTLPDIKDDDIPGFHVPRTISPSANTTLPPSSRENQTYVPSRSNSIQQQQSNQLVNDHMKSIDTFPHIYGLPITSPVSPTLDYRKWNFTEHVPKSSSTVSPRYDSRVSDNTRSILYPLFVTASPSPPTSSQNRTCDMSSPQFQCKGKAPHADTPDIESWCVVNCRAGNCVGHICVCGCGHVPEAVDQCHGIGVFASIPGMNKWCKAVCDKHKCPSNICDVKTCL